jgi:hypothetical protein
MSDLKEILLKINIHHFNYPDHGVNCACMDNYIREIRQMTKASTMDVQLRVDHVLRAALENR